MPQRTITIFRYRYAAWVSILLTVVSCKDDGLVPGKCGLEGHRVECITDHDCIDKMCGYKGCDYCTLSGECINAEWMPDCMRVGFPCPDDPELVCGGDRDCHPPCNTHHDCDPLSICLCLARSELSLDSPSAGECNIFRCIPDGICPLPFAPIEGTLACWPLSREGDCQKGFEPPGLDCPPGYVQEGPLGCRLLELYAWKNRDGGVREAGAVDGGGADAGTPDADAR